jgi:hypothetical protein
MNNYQYFLDNDPVNNNVLILFVVSNNLSENQLISLNVSLYWLSYPGGV